MIGTPIARVRMMLEWREFGTFLFMLGSLFGVTAAFIVLSVLCERLLEL
jgi:hypothetical protein